MSAVDVGLLLLHCSGLLGAEYDTEMTWMRVSVDDDYTIIRFCHTIFVQYKAQRIIAFYVVSWQCIVVLVG
jgi:hypothetical protein